MVIQFTMQEFMIFLLFVLGIITGILVLLILLKTKKTIGHLQTLLETNEDAINKTIKTLPGIFENVEQISIDLKETTEEIKVSIPTILQNAVCVTNVAKDSLDNETALKKDTLGFMAYFNAIEQVLHIISRIFPSKKKL